MARWRKRAAGRHALPRSRPAQWPRPGVLDDLHVLASDPGREFAFGVGGRGKFLNTWRYRLAPGPDGTEVTESFELTATPFLRLYWKLAGRWRLHTIVNGMRTTLERVKAVAESPD